MRSIIQSASYLFRGSARDATIQPEILLESSSQISNGGRELGGTERDAIHAEFNGLVTDVCSSTLDECEEIKELALRAKASYLKLSRRYRAVGGSDSAMSFSEEVIEKLPQEADELDSKRSVRFCNHVCLWN